MKKLTGKKVFNGVAIGKIYFYAKKENIVTRTKITDTDAEWQRYLDAREEAISQLTALYEKTKKIASEEEAEIFNVHIMMLEDEFSDSIENMIKTQNVNAEYATAQTGDNFADMFANMDDDYFKARAADVKDIAERVISILLGNQSGETNFDEPVIVVAEDLSPSETVQMDKDKILAFVTKLGSENSHTAILARTMGIPALVGAADVSEDINGKEAIVDGTEGLMIVEPDKETLENYEKVREQNRRQKELLKELRNKDTVTKSGRKVNLYANIGSIGDLNSVLVNGAEGIGLFRSEFIYLKSDSYPTEEEQFKIYRQVAETMAGKKVIIRTLDIGADKQVDYFDLGHEDNPALGFRAIRICLERPDVFKTQLRALYRASYYGNISIMFPMIISVDEVKRIKEIVAEVKCELDEDGIQYKDVELGVMIETPAAVMMSEEIGKEVDFFSIGTNDLTQYTLAIDRQNQRLENFYDPHHPAILKMLKMIVDNGHKSDCWVGICGELGADLELTKTFVEMGFDELSVSPAMVLPVREAIRNMD
ncbi:phosphotransferase system, enzyme I, PtsI [Pseudobutyrivibrio sp. JW11]|uniref:phosphoenolpyruvate--protein phosphotransferase n=1 Tax=Pseudobutyrivibrio sp. JW11 TaxID=1855302 RepID=UPI0008E66AC5|nr:phosphoenolpyruvate--protein phosphotransferase [Pseudobutyrivibrio sp. JW11]SFO53538.1 phosphotransferase system, enzyme I, PtsI [Pseudobutyrivibrio sp. JW11]